LDFEHALQHQRTSQVCAYVIRKALIRKHYLSNTMSTWLVKHPESVLARHFRPCVHFELDYAEFLDEALVDAWDLNKSMFALSNEGSAAIDDARGANQLSWVTVIELSSTSFIVWKCTALLKVRGIQRPGH